VCQLAGGLFGNAAGDAPGDGAHIELGSEEAGSAAPEIASGVEGNIAESGLAQYIPCRRPPVSAASVCKEANASAGLRLWSKCGLSPQVRMAASGVLIAREWHHGVKRDRTQTDNDATHRGVCVTQQRGLLVQTPLPHLGNFPPNAEEGSVPRGVCTGRGLHRHGNVGRVLAPSSAFYTACCDAFPIQVSLGITDNTVGSNTANA
jgi:hypothetical protein